MAYWLKWFTLIILCVGSAAFGIVCIIFNLPPVEVRCIVEDISISSYICVFKSSETCNSPMNYLTSVTLRCENVGERLLFDGQEQSCQCCDRSFGPYCVVKDERVDGGFLRRDYWKLISIDPNAFSKQLKNRTQFYIQDGVILFSLDSDIYVNSGTLIFMGVFICFWSIVGFIMGARSLVRRRYQRVTNVIQ
jgi:hypothetical protein